MVQLSEPILKIKPHLLTFLIITMVIFSSQIYVDCYMYAHAHEYVVSSKIDLEVYISTHDEISLEESYADRLVKNILDSTSYIIDYFDFYSVYVDMIHKNGTYNVPLYYQPLYIAENATLSKLNVSIMIGEFNDSGVIINKEIIGMLGINVGDYIVLNYTYWIGEVMKTKAIVVKVVGLFNITESSIYKFYFFVSQNYFTSNLRRSLRIIQRNAYIQFSHVYFADIDESFIDYVNPDSTITKLNNLLESIYALNKRTGYSPYIYASSSLMSQLYYYMHVRENMKFNLFVASLPLILGFFIIAVYVVNYLITKWKRELLIMVARGWLLDAGIAQLLLELLKSFVLGLIIGILVSLGLSRLYLIIIPFSLGEPVVYSSITSFPFVISFSTLQSGLMYSAAIFIGSIFSYSIVAIYRKIQRNIEKRERGILKKIYSFFGEASVYVLMFLFGILVVFQSLYYSINEYVRYFLPYMLIYLISPYALLLSLIYFFILFMRKYGITKISQYSMRKNFTRALLAMKNVLRKDSFLATITLIFAFMISINVLTVSVATEYAPFTLDSYRYTFGGDMVFTFYTDANKTEVMTFVDNVSSIPGIETYTIIYTSYLYVSDQRYSIMGIDPLSFVNCVYTMGGKLLKDTSYSQMILRINETLKSSVISESVSTNLGLYENDTLKYYDEINRRIDYFEVVGVVDLSFPYIWSGSFWYYYEFLYSDYEYASTTLPWFYTYRIENYILINDAFYDTYNQSMHVAIVYTLSPSANSTEIRENLANNIEKTPIRNTSIPEYVMYYTLLSAIEYYQDTITSPIYRQMFGTFNINFLFSTIYLVLALWIYASIIERKRSHEFGIILAMGMTKRDLLQSILYETLFIFIISIPFGLLSIFVSTPIFAYAINMPAYYLFIFYNSVEFLQLVGLVLLSTLFSVVLFGLYIIFKGTRMEITKLLRIEWASEELEEELEVVL